jgi:hypothetical protein
MSRIADFGLRIGRGWPVATLHNFTVSGAAATVGATYTNNGVTFTVLTTITSTATSLFCSGTGVPSGSTLTYATGTGDATITFTNWINAQNDGIGIYTTNSGSLVTTAGQVAALFSVTNGNPPFDISEPPVGSLVIANGVLGQAGAATIWLHASPGTAGTSWTGITATGGTLQAIINDIGSTTGTEVSYLAGSGLTAAKTASAFGSAGKLVHTCYTTTATYAQLNAGLTLVAAPGAGIILTPVAIDVIVNGATAWADCTALVLKDTSQTVTIATIPVASLAGYAHINGPSSTISLGAGYRGALTTNNGIMAITTGTIESHGSQIFVELKYVI